MSDAVKPSLYELLGVSPDVSQPDLARAYRRRARELHPDLAPSGSDAADAFAALSQAYQMLADPSRRAAYDATLRDPTPPTTGHAVPVRIRRVAAGSPTPSLHLATLRDRRQPPIVAGPTQVSPNDPEATR
jgi:curved DNA-binding protein CbpA